MRRFMDCIFRGLIKIVSKNANITFVTKDGTRTGKNFSIRVLANGSDGGNRFVIQSTDSDGKVIEWLFSMDWDTGEITYAGNINAPGINVGANSNPVSKQGGFYWNNSVKRYYKCEDGTNWINFFKTNCLDLSVDSLPSTTIQGGLVFLKTDKKYYKCADGNNWVEANI